VESLAAADAADVLNFFSQVGTRPLDNCLRERYDDRVPFGYPEGIRDDRRATGPGE
jgi:hypothetical protein